MFLERWLNLLEEIPQLFLGLAVHDWRSMSIQSTQNMGHMFIIRIILEFLENFANLTAIKRGRLNTLLLDLRLNIVKDFLGNLRAFLRLELCEPLIEMIDTLVCVI